MPRMKVASWSVTEHRCFAVNRASVPWPVSATRQMLILKPDENQLCSVASIFQDSREARDTIADRVTVNVRLGDSFGESTSMAI